MLYLKTFCFIYFLLNLNASDCVGQNALTISHIERLLLQQTQVKKVPTAPLSLGLHEPPHINNTYQNTQSCMVAPTFDADKLPFFCKIEHQIGKRLPMPILFRLGSVEYVNYLEGKTDSYNH
jgi:hypothetical protein